MTSAVVCSETWLMFVVGSHAAFHMGTVHVRMHLVTHVGGVHIGVHLLFHCTGRYLVVERV